MDQDPLEITLTIDGRSIPEGSQRAGITFGASDSNKEYFYYVIMMNVISDEARYGRITQGIHKFREYLLVKTPLNIPFNLPITGSGSRHKTSAGRIRIESAFQ